MLGHVLKDIYYILRNILFNCLKSSIKVFLASVYAIAEHRHIFIHSNTIYVSDLPELETRTRSAVDDVASVVVSVNGGVGCAIRRHASKLEGNLMVLNVTESLRGRDIYICD